MYVTYNVLQRTWSGNDRIHQTILSASHHVSSHPLHKPIRRLQDDIHLVATMALFILSRMLMCSSNLSLSEQIIRTVGSSTSTNALGSNGVTSGTSDTSSSSNSVNNGVQIACFTADLGRVYLSLALHMVNLTMTYHCANNTHVRSRFFIFTNHCNTSDHEIAQESNPYLYDGTIALIDTPKLGWPHK